MWLSCKIYETKEHSNGGKPNSYNLNTSTKLSWENYQQKITLQRGKRIQKYKCGLEQYEDCKTRYTTEMKHSGTRKRTHEGKGEQVHTIRNQGRRSDRCHMKKGKWPETWGELPFKIKQEVTRQKPRRRQPSPRCDNYCVLLWLNPPGST